MESLVSLCLEATLRNASLYLKSTGICLLPNHLKNRLLKMFLSSKLFCSRIDLNAFLTATINQTTTLVNLSNINCDGIKLDILQKASNLKQLRLANATDNSITTNDLLNLFQQTKFLLILSLEKCSHVTDEVLCSIASHCPQMRELNLGHCQKITDNGVVALQNLPLVSLSVAHTQVTSDGILKLSTGTCRKTLKELNLNNSKFEANQVVLLEIMKNCRLLSGFNINHALFDCIEDSVFKNLRYFTCTIKL